MRSLPAAILVLVVLLICLRASAQGEPPSGQGFLCNPPVYVNNEPDFPLAGLGVIMPKAGQTVPELDVSGLRAEAWNVNGVDVEPDLRMECNWIRVGALRGFKGGWAAGLSVPWYRNVVGGQIGGQPACGVADGLGNIAVAAKKVLWEDCSTGRRLILGVGLELPTGASQQRFGPDNEVTNGYFSSPTRRMPLGWQPSTGTFNGLAALAYGRSRGRTAWQALVAGKLHGTADEDVKLGDVFIASINGTYGASRDLACSLGFTARVQGNDSYPNSPLPVNGPELQGTSNHRTIVYLDASLRYTVMRKVTVGLGIRTPIVHPDDGMDPRMMVSWIFYPNTN